MSPVLADSLAAAPTDLFTRPFTCHERCVRPPQPKDPPP